jgi:hypothetical protein
VTKEHLVANVMRLERLASEMHRALLLDIEVRRLHYGENGVRLLAHEISRVSEVILEEVRHH